MRIEEISLMNFRNLTRAAFKPEPRLNVFIGQNAAGKTSLLEAVYLLARPLSFRPATEETLLQDTANAFAVRALTAAETESGKILKNRLLLQYEKGGKKQLFLNGKRSGYRYKGRLRVVLFTPDDLSLIKGTPAKRRRYLDFLLAQLDPEYERAFSDYTKLLKKRGQLLRDHLTEGPAFAALNEVFVQTAVKLTLSRIRLVAALEPLAKDFFKSLYPESLQMTLRYAMSFSYTGSLSEETLALGLTAKMAEVAKRELYTGRTLVGPHVDDLNIYLNMKLAKNFSSQGQQRSLAIALKMAEAEIYRVKTNDYPVVLLDEVLSELDENKKNELFTWLKEADFQSFLTAVNLSDIKDPDGAKVTTVQDGTLL